MIICANLGDLYFETNQFAIAIEHYKNFLNTTI